MSSNNYKYIKIGSNTGKSEYKNWTNTSFWQSNIWADILRKTYQAQDIFLCFSDTHAVLLERRTIFRNYTGLYILGVDWVGIHEDLLAFICSDIKNQNDLFLQIEPLTPTNIHGEIAPFRRFIEPVTAVLNLKTSEGILLASFAEKGRYNIRLAQKRWVTTKWVKWSDSYGEKTYLDAFYNILDETTKRDGFSHNSLIYYKHFVETLEENNAGGLLVAEKDGVLHAAGIFAYWRKDAIYYYGASSNDREIRRDMATYLLQWSAIQEGMKRGCETYDFLGISEDGKWKLAGVTEFKLRFNPEKIHFPEEIVIIYKPLLLKLLQFVSKIRKLFR
jgi:lipid II:glycine glycyltransferase (peptidoglycan interpeptide bridge formation enzyme)